MSPSDFTLRLIAGCTLFHPQLASITRSLMRRAHPALVEPSPVASAASTFFGHELAAICDGTVEGIRRRCQGQLSAIKEGMSPNRCVRVDVNAGQ